HVLHLHHLAEAGPTVGAADAAVADAAPGCGRLAVARHAVVDGHDPGLELALEPTRGLGVAGPAARGEAVGAVVCDPDRLVERGPGHDGQDGTEGLLAHDLHAVVDSRQHGGRVEEARPLGTRAAHEDRGPLGPRLVDVLLHDPTLALEGHRPHV